MKVVPGDCNMIGILDPQAGEICGATARGEIVVGDRDVGGVC